MQHWTGDKEGSSSECCLLGEWGVFPLGARDHFGIKRGKGKLIEEESSPKRELFS